jgi:hypothetical protein
MSWHFDPKDYHFSNAIEVFEYAGVPVIIRRQGSYAQAIDGGRSTRDLPHIEINLAEGYKMADGGWAVTSTISAVAAEQIGARRFLNVDFQPAQTAETTEAELIAMAKARLDDAVATLARLDHAYAAASARCAGMQAYSTPLSRPEYEAACAAMAIEPMSDADVDSYGVRYGDWRFPAVPAETIVAMHLAAWRLKKIDADLAEAKAVAKLAAPAAVSAPPRKTGQIWEPCSCGAEPVNMPLMLCDKCWPGTAASGSRQEN